MSRDAAPDEPELDPKQLIKIAIDLGPLVVFFASYMLGGIYVATAVLMGATVLSMILSRLLLGHISTTLIITTALVVGFGALTLWFNDPRFIKMKPTIVYLLFALVLLGGLLAGRPLLRYVLGEALQLTDAGWRILSWRWGAFFVAMAALNEIIWRNFSETTWASFKAFGFLPLTLIFFASQYGVMRRHQVAASDDGKPSA